MNIFTSLFWKETVVHPRISRRTKEQQEYRDELCKNLTKYLSQGDLWRELAKDLLEKEKKSPKFKESRHGATKSLVIEMFQKKDPDAINNLNKLEEEERKEVEKQVIYSYVDQVENIMKNTKNKKDLIQYLVRKVTTIQDRDPDYRASDHYDDIDRAKESQTSHMKDIFMHVFPEDIKNILQMSFCPDNKEHRTSTGLRWSIVSNYMDKVSEEDQKDIIDILTKNGISIYPYQNQIYSKNRKYIWKDHVCKRWFSSLTQKSRKLFSSKERKEIYTNLIENKNVDYLARNLEFVDEDFHQTVLNILAKQEKYVPIIKHRSKRKRIKINKYLWTELVKAWYGDKLREAMKKNPKMFSK